METSHLRCIQYFYDRLIGSYNMIDLHNASVENP